MFDSGMKNLGWLFIAFLVAIVILFMVYPAQPAEPTLRDRLVQVQQQVGTRAEPTVDADAMADAVLAVTNDRDWIALLITIAAHESRLSARIAANECKPWECDAVKRRDPLTHELITFHQAAGLFQEHRNANNAGTWGSPELAVQVRSGYALLRRSYWSCRRLAPSTNWVAFTINAYAGKRCDAEWQGLTDRLATWQRVRAKL